MRSLLLALIATFWAALVTHGQDARQLPPRFRGGVDLVQLDITVLDKKRQPVRGLNAEDFVILEDSKPQTPVAFSEVVLPASPASTAAWTREVGADVASNENQSRRRVIIVLDDAFTSFYQGEPRLARLIGHAAIDQLGPTDLAAVVFTYSGRAQEFTADRAKLRSAVESFVPRNSKSAGEPLGCLLRPESCAGNSLLRIGQVLEGAEGPKVIIFISPTATFRSLTGPGVVMGLAGERVTRTEVLRTLQRGNVRLYAFHPAGLAYDSTLLELSEGTGARATVNTNAPEKHVSRAFEESRSYYAVAYQSANLRADGQFREIKVAIRGRPDLTALTRSGYQGPRPPSTRSGPPELDAAIARGLPTGDLPMSAVATALAVPGSREAEVIAVVQILEAAENDAPSEGGSIRRDVSLVAAAFDTSWAERASSREQATVTLPAAARGPQSYVLATRLALRPGRYQLRLAATSAGKVGSVFVDLTVPNFENDPLTLSGPVLAKTEPESVVAGPGVMDRIPVVPTTVRQFAREDRITSFVRIRQGGNRPLLSVTVATRIVDDRDKTVSSDRLELLADRFDRNRSVDINALVPLAGLEPGDYVLVTTVTAEKNEVERKIRFAVR
jgi:VWFA-related protein